MWRFYRRREAELDEEVRRHLEMAVRDRVERGEPPDRARAAALREFGNPALVKEVVRDMWRWQSLERLAQDLRFGVRLLRRSPSFAIVSLICIALGIGVTTTMFSAVNGMLLHPLPYPDADRMAIIHTRDVTQVRDTGAVSWADFVFWRKQARSFAAMGAWGARPADVIEPGAEPYETRLGLISAGVLPALGIAPAIGRPFEEPDQEFGRHFVALLSHDFWISRYGGRADVVGQSIVIEQRPVPPTPFTIVGVLPAGTTFPPLVDLFVPLQVDADEYEQHRSRQATGVVARLRDGVALEQARAEIVGISRQLQAAFPADNANREAQVTTPRDELVGDRRTPVLLLQGAALFVLLIACANVANLTLARAAVRRRELAVRTAIGAGRGRLLRQLLTESLVLALAGGALGVLLALAGNRLLVLILPGGLPEFTDLSVDATALTFTIVISVISGVLFGLAPAWQGATQRPYAFHEVVRSGASPGATRLRRLLIVAETALSFVLVAGAVLVWRSNVTLGQELRYDKHVLWISVPTPAQRYEGERRERFFTELADRIRTLPDVVSVGRAASGAPLGTFSAQRVPIEVEGSATPLPQPPQAIVTEVDPAYLTTIGIPIVRGRGFNDDDRPPSRDVRDVRHFAAVVNETFARMYLGSEAVGARVRAQLPGAWSLGALTFTVVGVSRDFRQERPPAAIAPVMHVYVPLGSSNTPLVVQTRSDPAVVRQSVRAIVRQMDPALRVAVVQSFEEALARGLAQERLYQRVLGLFAALALGIAVIGVYGVISYVVAQRMREFGVRATLGARRGHLFGMVVGQGFRPTIAGLGLGIAMALILTRVLSPVLYGIGPHDPATFAVASVSLLALSILAGMWPAARAARVNPADILRTE